MLLGFFVADRHHVDCISPSDKIDFVRDVLAYMCVVALVIGVAYDGNVSLSCNYVM